MNKKGFTIIELLAVIVVLSILTTIIIASISGYLKKGKEEYMNGLEKQLLIAGKDYYSNNYAQIPTSKSNSRVSIISEPELRTKNYLSKELLDTDGNNCADSYVLVYNDDKDTDYNACLICNGTVYSTNYACKYKPTGNPTCKIDRAGNITTLYNEDNNIINTAVSNFSKVVIKNDNNEIVKSIEINSINTLTSLNSEIQKYFQNKKGIYRVFVQNIGLEKANCGTASIDNITAKCGLTEYKTGEETDYKLIDKELSWTNKNRSIKQYCPGTIETYKQITYDKTMVNDSASFTTTNGGKSISCTYDIKVDKTDPTCKSYYRTVTTDNKVKIVLFCEDEHSKCVKDRYEEITNYDNSKEVVNTNIDIKDNAGNITTCKVAAKVTGDPKATLTRPGNSTTFTGTGTDQEGIVAYAFTNSSVTPNSWTNVTATKTLSITKNPGMGNSSNILYFHVKDKEGKTAYAKRNYYVRCDSTKWQIDPNTGLTQDMLDNGPKIYGFKNKDADCSTKKGHRPVRHYYFSMYLCFCSIDTIDQKYCGLGEARDIIPQRHSGGREATFLYRKSENGSNACNGVYPFNSFIYNACSYDVNDSLSFHGYKWYAHSLPAGGYQNFLKSGDKFFLHSNGSYDAYSGPGYDSNTYQACKTACNVSKYNK